MKSFRTLELAIRFNDQVNAMAISGHLRDQLLRAASSIALNLSEGNAKFSVREKKRFFLMAYASQKESQTILRLLHNKDEEAEKTLSHLGANIFKLLQSDIKEFQSRDKIK